MIVSGFFFLEKYSIPPLTTAVVYPYILHRNQDIFKNPDKFIPERFLEEDNKSNFLFGYLPFSAGSRNCIGKFIHLYNLSSDFNALHFFFFFKSFYDLTLRQTFSL